jgi:hypothetical protein
MTARSNVSERLYFLADFETASETCRHCEGVHAGVCQRIFSFTEQMVLVRHGSRLGPPESPDGTDDEARAGTGSSPGTDRVRAVGGVEAFALGLESPWKRAAHATPKRAAPPQYSSFRR